MTAASPTESWETLDWIHIQKNVYRLQKRIYRASKKGEWKTVRSLQRLSENFYALNGGKIVVNKTRGFITN